MRGKQRMPLRSRRARIGTAAALALPAALAVLAAGKGLPPGRAEPPDGLKENLDLPYDAAGMESGEDAPEIVVFYGAPYEADGFFYCLDASLSMADGEWRRLQAELLKNLREFSSRVEFAIVFFAEGIASYPEARRAARATPAAKAEAAEKVRAVEPGQWTCLLEGILATIEAANRSTAERKAVIVMSDGKPACPGTDFVTYREKIFTEARAANRQRIPIHAIGVGSDLDETFLKRLAAEHGGTYRRVR